MKYETYWSLFDTPSNSISSDIVLFIALLISIFVFLIILKFKKSNFEKKFYLFIVGIFILITLPMYIHTRFFAKDDSQQRLIEFINSSERKVVEGKISNFTRGHKGKTSFESFDVDSIHFEYYDNAISEFSHFGGNHSNVFHDGLNVRIIYANGEANNEILKLEIEK